MTQDRLQEVEVVVADGASTNGAEAMTRRYAACHRNVRYVRLPQKSGVDRDIAVSYTRGGYCWLFSGDDWMFEGALARIAPDRQRLGRLSVQA